MQQMQAPPAQQQYIQVPMQQQQQYIQVPAQQQQQQYIQAPTDGALPASAPGVLQMYLVPHQQQQQQQDADNGYIPPRHPT